MGKFVVEDHGNGFMVLGTNNHRKARKVLRDYVSKKKLKTLRFACPTQYDGRSSVWLSDGPAEAWDGARDHCGNPLPR